MKNNLKISKEFTIADIRKIRRANHRLCKKIGFEAYKTQLSETVKEVLKLMPNVKLVKINELNTRN